MMTHLFKFTKRRSRMEGPSSVQGGCPWANVEAIATAMSDPTRQCCAKLYSRHLMPLIVRCKC